MTVRWSLLYPSVKKMQVRVIGTAFLLGCLFVPEVHSAPQVAADSTAQQYRLLARIDRLEAEEKGDSVIAFRSELLEAASSDPAIAAMLEETRHQFETRRQALQQVQQQLRDRIQQAAAAIDEQQQQLSSNRNRIALISDKLKSLHAAIEKGLIGQNYVDALRSEVEQLEALCGEMEDGIAQAKWSVAEYQLEQSRLELDRRRVAQAELEALTAKLLKSAPNQMASPDSRAAAQADETPDSSGSSSLQTSQSVQTTLE
ncbi:hypothetical protein GCM10011352_26520 [Marinobacterium zhoushanense]|uniref:AprE-like long alpha-helical hairpin domain-containing protein n=1 Tax=Marinobacterium zhoushanense TaxID=1679163 RepID=A0ABQ1KKW6_9GAMM|nr:hypothetical protein [Marinobacterium zhoushanense]GGB99042.1 hypothetical protein GCM10011352_26520 [Marinobacterium zhoushanense]